MPENSSGDSLEARMRENERLDRELDREDDINRHNELVTVMIRLTHALEGSRGRENESVLTLRELVRVLKENNVVTRRSIDANKTSGRDSGGIAGTLRSMIGGPVGGAMSLFMGKLSLEKIVDIADSVIKLVDEQIVTARKLRATLTMPGMNLGQVGTQEMWSMAKNIDATMQKFSSGIFGLEDFQKIIMELKQSGMATTMPLVGGRSFIELGKDIGALSGGLKKAVEDIPKVAQRAVVREDRVPHATDEGRTPEEQGVAPQPIYSNTPTSEEQRKIDSYTIEKIKPLTDRLAETNAELVMFALNTAKLSMVTGMSTTELIKNADKLNRVNIGFGGVNSSLDTLNRNVITTSKEEKSVISTMRGVAESAILGSIAFNDVKIPAEEFTSDITNAAQTMRFFSGDIEKSKKQLIGLGIKEKEALQALIFTITDVTNLMDATTRPDMTQAALGLEVLKRNPGKYGGLNKAISGASTETQLMAIPLLAQFNAAERDRYQRELADAKVAGREAPMMPEAFQILANELHTDFPGLLKLAPEIDRLLTDMPKNLTEMSGLKGGAKLLFEREAVPEMVPWFKMGGSKERMVTDAMMNFSDGLDDALKIATKSLSRNTNAINEQLTQGQFDVKINDTFSKITAGIVAMLARGITGDVSINTSDVTVNSNSVWSEILKSSPGASK